MKMRTLQACARIIICAVVAFWTLSVVERAVFATPSWMHTVSRNLEGRSLAAKSAQEFKKKQLAAAAAEGQVVPGGAFIIPFFAGFGYAAMCAKRIIASRRRNKTGHIDNGLIQIGNMGAVFAIWFAVAAITFLSNMPGAKKRKRMHMLYAQHADLLYSLLQNPKFKKRMRVKSWEHVRRRRKQAEIAGIIVQIAGPVFGFFALKSLANFLKNTQTIRAAAIDASLIMGYAAVAWPILIGITAKAFITCVMRRKGGASQLNQEFARAIAVAKAQEDLAEPGHVCA